MAQEQVKHSDNGDEEGSAALMPVHDDELDQTLDDTDDLLDEIDNVLEENAEDFVRSYVQKGGQ